MLKEHLQSISETQRAFACRLGISGAFLSQIMAGNRRPSLDLAIRIARLTGGAVPVESWVPGEPVSERPLGDAA
jgi:transcriptional regulator with XRE-family HTH domain